MVKYNDDRYGWAVNTAQLLRDGKMNEIDIDDLIEEMDSMVSSHEGELINRLSLILSHLLKCQFQPAMKGHSWIYTIREQRSRAKSHYRDNPSLKSKLNKIIEDAYSAARYRAAKDTGFEAKAFPEICPYTFEQIMDDDFYPGDSL